MCRILLFAVFCYLFTAMPIMRVRGEESAQYLQNAISDLRQMKEGNVADMSKLKRVDTGKFQAIIPANDPIDKSAERQWNEPKVAATGTTVATIPPLTLTKGELAAIYETAVKNKGSTTKFKVNSEDKGYVNALVHEIHDSDSVHHNTDNKGSSSALGEQTGDQSSYYYYYYPVKSFLDEITSQTTSVDHHYTDHPDHTDHHYAHEVITDKPQFQYHAHTHQHNIKITKDLAYEKKKGLQPLFMAISGFIGMAVMYLISVLVLPKLGLKKRGAFGKVTVKKNERISEMARVALQAIEGKYCEERFACELEKTARAFNIQDNRFVKLLKRMVPASFGKKGNNANKFSNQKRLRCKAIPCKKKNRNETQPKKKPNATVHKKT